MKRLLSTILLPALVMSLSGCVSDRDEFDHLYRDLPFEMERVTRPDIPSRQLSLSDFEAKGDGIFMNTEAFAQAIEQLCSMGGGRLNVPAGVYLTGPIELKSHIDLHLEENAIIVFSDNKDLYPLIPTSYEGVDTRRCESPLHAEGQHDIAITGKGVIDGNGAYWKSLKRAKVSSSVWNSRLAWGGCVSEDGTTWYPDESYPIAEGITGMSTLPYETPDSVWTEIRSYLRPVMVSLRNCERILLEGCTYQNPPAWHIHPLMCKDIIVKNIHVETPPYTQNTDGIDLESCERVIVSGCSFSCGDDGICIKSGRDGWGRRRAMPSQNILIDNCTVFQGHGGLVIGSEMSGGVRNIRMTRCRFLGTDTGLRFKSRRGRGGVVSDVWVEDTYMAGIAADAIEFDLYYRGARRTQASDGSEYDMHQVDETTPLFRDIHIKGLRCNGAGRAMFINGLPEMYLHGIDISDCSISCSKGVEINWAEDITLSNVEIGNTLGEKYLITTQTKNINIL